MSEAARTGSAPAEAKGPSRITELKVSGHLMTLDAGLFCVFQSGGGAVAKDGSGLPGVRISLPPRTGGADQVSISSFRQDGWLGGRDDAALVRVAAGPAQILVTIYQSSAHGADSAPRLQVLRLTPDSRSVAPLAPEQTAAASSPATPDEAGLPKDADTVAHVQRTGDVTGQVGEWIGKPGSKLWIEGFGFLPQSGIEVADLEYQAVLGRGWMSPWVEGGKYCGSRGMALPLLGLRLRLRGEAADAFDCSYSATFVDGTSVGPVPAGESCEAESLAPLEAFKIVLGRRDNGAVGLESGAGQEVSQPVRGAAKPPRQAVPIRKPVATKRR